MEIDPNVLESYLGMGEELKTGKMRYDSSLRAILLTDMESSTSITERLGDEQAAGVRHRHDDIVSRSLVGSGGRVIKHTGDGIMGCLSSVVRAAECAIEIQQQLSQQYEPDAFPVRVRVGLTAGEPVTEDDDLFGTTVIQARRICDAAEPGWILASGVIRELSLGKSFKWEDQGDVPLKGFEEPVRLHRLLWN